MPKEPLLLPYQRRWVEDNSRIKLMEKSRQIGMSWASAYRLVRQQCQQPRFDAWVSSRDETQAQLFLEDCRKWARILDLSSSHQVLDTAHSSTFTLSFTNGRRIHSMSSNPDAQAGKRGTRVLDEFALHPDPRRLYAIAYPGITWGGQLEIISTHRGSHNLFAQLVEEVREGGNPKGISLHSVTLQDALDQGFLNRLKQRLPEDDPRQEMDDASYYDFIRSGCPDEATFRQEFCCIPQDDTAHFLSYDLIHSCAVPESIPWQQDSGKGTLYLGVDIGRDHDRTVFWLVEMLGDTAWTRSIEVLHQCPFSEQEARLRHYLANPRLHRTCIDQSGIGRQFAERASQRHGRYRIEGLAFTAALKETLAYQVRTTFEDRRIRIPDTEEVIQDLHSIRRETAQSGHIRFSAPHSAKGHADRFWALALALQAASQPAKTTHSQALPRLSARHRAL